ncbi:MAG: glycosyltransferase family 4 protein [Acidimicrobiales bacterium]
MAERVRRHLLVTNDFPPKLGGIQSYLWELWRRLPSDSFAVLTTPHRGAKEWDAEQPFRVVRDRDKWLLPHSGLVKRIDQLAAETDADLVVLDPALPIGGLGPKLQLPYGVVVHGAEVAVPGRIPGSRSALGKVLVGARIVIAAGGYPAAEAERAAGQTLPTVIIPPGVDTDRFRPLNSVERAAARDRLAIPADVIVLHCGSRLVPRKGFDNVIRAAARLRHRYPQLFVLVSGSGRDRGRLERLARELRAPVRFLGRVDDAVLPEIYGSADLFAMMCRTRWGGLEQEGFGIVFLEAAAAGIPQLAGQSGGAAESCR